MRGGMVGFVVDDKENMLVWGEGKNRRKSGEIGSVWRLSISGFKLYMYYLRVIVNWFKCKGVVGWGCIIVY